MDGIASAEEDWGRLYLAKQDGLVDHLEEEDRPWLETALSDEKSGGTTCSCTSCTDRSLEWAWEDRPGVGSNSSIAERRCRARPNSGRSGRLYPSGISIKRKPIRLARKHRQRQRADAEREANRLERWREWRENFLDESDRSIFRAESARDTIRHSHMAKGKFSRPQSLKLLGQRGSDAGLRS